MGDTVIATRSGHVATLTLNRPERLNGMTAELVEDLIVGLEGAAEDDDVRVVVLTGAGRAFCPGADLKAMNDRPRSGEGADARGFEERAASVRALERSSELLHAMPKVTIAAVNGACAGAGLSWACACDLRYAARTAVFRTAFAAAGQTGDFGGTWTIPRLVGAGRARELYFLSDRFGAEDAERIGLVTGVVDDDGLMAHVAGVAERIAAYAPLAVRGIKANLLDAEEADLGTVLDAEARRLVLNGATEDSAEAVRAFVEKRTPVFKGR